MGSIGGPDILGDIFQMLFTNLTHFEEQEMLPGKNVYVFSANSSSSRTISNYVNNEAYTTYAPFVDNNGDFYQVEVQRSYNANITITQEALVVLIIWDDDGSLVKNVIIPMVRLINDFIAWHEENPDAEEVPEQLVRDTARLATWIVMHINDIITGDEQFLFQPSYRYSHTISGDYSDTRTWTRMSDNVSIPDPLSIPGLSQAAAENEYLAYLAQGSPPLVGSTVTYTSFMFHMFQFWMQKLQIQLDLSQLTGIINQMNGEVGGGGSSSENPFQNLLEGIELEFSIIQHHLLGGILFNDSQGNGVPSVEYVDVPDMFYTDSRNISQQVVVPNATDARYIMDISDPGAGWVIQAPQADPTGTNISWSVSFQNPKVQFRPIGMGQQEFSTSPARQEYDMEYMSFGFTFEPRFLEVAVPDEAGNEVRRVRFGKGTVKLDQSFGAITGLPQHLSELALAVFYFSHVLHFQLNFENMETAGGQDVDHYYRSETGTLDFLSAEDQHYFGAIDIAGPDYETGGTTYPAQTAVVPFALFNYVFEGQQTVANDNASIDAGGTAFRQQSLFVELTSAWAFYVVAYPEWNGGELIHDPMFSIFMSIESEIPWGFILLVAAIGAIVAASVVLWMKRQGRF